MGSGSELRVHDNFFIWPVFREADPLIKAFSKSQRPCINISTQQARWNITSSISGRVLRKKVPCHSFGGFTLKHTGIRNPACALLPHYNWLISYASICKSILMTQLQWHDESCKQSIAYPSLVVRNHRLVGLFIFVVSHLSVTIFTDTQISRHSTPSSSRLIQKALFILPGVA